MSGGQVCVPAPLLIFGDVRVRGFWLTGGYARMREGWRAKEALVDRVVALYRQRAIRPNPVECVPLERWREALALHREPFRGAKVLLTNYRDEDACR